MPTISDPGTLTGRNHPGTSYAAADAVLPKTGTQRRRVYDAIQLAGGLTDVELQEVLELSPNSERPRRVELVRDGFIKDSGRVRQHAGRSHIVWEVC